MREPIQLRRANLVDNLQVEVASRFFLKICHRTLPSLLLRFLENWQVSVLFHGGYAKTCALSGQYNVLTALKHQNQVLVQFTNKSPLYIRASIQGPSRN